MHSVDYLTNCNKWVILDDNHQEVFRGTKKECEDWLDQHENNKKNPWRSFLHDIVKK